jgi:hypothetical protein
MSNRQRGVVFGVALLVLAVIAVWSPLPDRVTDRDVYEATADRGIVRDCTDLHCFRVLVPWVIGSVPGSSLLKWKIYAVVANATAVVVVLELALLMGLSRRGALLAAALTGLGFGSLYTLHDVYTADPLMYALAPVVTILLFRDRVAVAAMVATVGVLAKEFVAAPLYIYAAASAWSRQWPRAWSALAAANTAFIAWLLLQLTLIVGFNYGYGDNPSTKLLSGGYVRHWLELQSPRGAMSALLNEFGALYVLAPMGLMFLATGWRRFVIAAVPVALVFGYVQQPDRALWNFHFLVTPLAALVLERVSPILAAATVALFAVANLRVGAQLEWVPAARFAMAGSLILALVACAVVWKGRTTSTVSTLPSPA